MFRKVLLPFLLIPTSFLSYSQEFDSVKIISHKITESIYMLEGRGGNIGLCVGEDGAFIIDDQFAPLTEKIKAVIAEITDQSIEFVINTHYHHDHTGGNENFGKGGSIIISHDNTRENIQADQLKRIAQEGKSEFPDESLPVITFSETMALHFNGETINIFHVDNAHTDGDVIIHFQNANVYHMGDVFVRYGFPYIDMEHGGNINGFIDALEKAGMMMNNQTKVIPGHGQISVRQDVIDLKEWLTDIRDVVKKLKDEGKSKEEIISLNPLKEVISADANLESIVNMVYEGLE